MPKNLDFKLDVLYLSRLSAPTRLFLRLFRGAINVFVVAGLLSARERGLIGSQTLHELTGLFARRLWPERHNLNDRDTAGDA